MTGELWILIQKEFILYKIIKLKNVHSFCIDQDKEIDIFNFEFTIKEEK